tara:strand:+ start:1887 stop:2411 length:525 start_codon:yes stop_codon:yes gene_type:complete
MEIGRDTVKGLNKGFGGSELFKRTYREGMALVEEAASYLDGPGREQAKDLPRATALAYATESMRMTTRLMQVAAWLLVQKAVHEGEMTETEALSEKYELGGRDLAKTEPAKAAQMLPDVLRDLIQRSENIYERIDRLDAQLRAGEEPSRSALTSQQAKVEAFFRDTLNTKYTKH